MKIINKQLAIFSFIVILSDGYIQKKQLFGIEFLALNGTITLFLNFNNMQCR